MPRTVQEVLNERVFSQKIPFVFSSATLSQNNSFDYVANSLGILKYLSFTVESPFEYEEVMQLFFKRITAENSFDQKLQTTLTQIEKSKGRALILFNTSEELDEFKQAVGQIPDYTFLFEGDKEISDLVSTFQNNEETILCAVHLWEGLDIPGPSLSNVIIWSLPFPPNDPVFQSKRKQVKDYIWEVEIPYMLLRLRQGIGRLIRTSRDQGMITIMLPSSLDSNILEAIENILPTRPEVLTG
jgi:ATP-dependent DNA helicase DinG